MATGNREDEAQEKAVFLMVIVEHSYKDLSDLVHPDNQQTKGMRSS